MVIISLYFALTTLSTVGYGDITPISRNEQLTAVIVMLCGVAFFSYIMGNFIEIISNIHSKMGAVDRSAELDRWITSLSRFTNYQPLPKSLHLRIEKDFNYAWLNDSIQCFVFEADLIKMLPVKIKQQLITSYLFSDQFYNSYRRFFDCDTKGKYEMLQDLSFGMVPRHFDHEERILYDEDQEVSEMYFVQKGFIGIGFSIMSNGINGRNYMVSKR